MGKLGTSIIAVVYLLFICAACPPFSQYKSGIINDAFKKRIKINRLRFFFRAPCGASVSKEGVALPSFVFQVVGYILCFALAVLNLICAIKSEKTFFLMVIITFFIVTTELIVLCLFNGILSMISKKRINQKHEE